MSITQNETAFVVQGGEQVGFSQMFTVTSDGANPARLVLSGLDRDYYSAGATGDTGTLSGDGQTDGFIYDTSGDTVNRSIGIVFTYQSSTGQYYNPQYGALNQMVYTASASLGDLANLSLYGYSSNTIFSQNYAADPFSLMQTGQYFGSVDILTQTTFKGSVPVQATPDSIASIAQSFVGDTWNSTGCWVFANTVATEAGAALPVQTSVLSPGVANGEWQVAYNGPEGQSGDWQSMVQTGDVVVIENSDGSGHVTVCVSGSGSTAELVDNSVVANAQGNLQNSANDGDPSDIIIPPAHPASDEWTGINSKNVVIYRLDTPVLTVNQPTAVLSVGQQIALSSVFSATDPFGKSITEYQVYDTSTSDSLTVNGASVSAHNAAGAATVTSLDGVNMNVGSASTGYDTVEVRASNDSYWGDWTTLDVTVDGVESFLDGTSAATTTPDVSVTGVSGGFAYVASNPYDAVYTQNGGRSNVFLKGDNESVYSAGSDTVVAGAGSATIAATADAQVWGGSGTLSFINGKGHGTVISGSGDATLTGGAGSLTFWGGQGAASVTGGSAGHNVLVAGSGNTTLVGGGNDDLFVGGSLSSQSVTVETVGQSTVFGGSSANRVVVGGADATVVGGAGILDVQGGAGSVDVWGGDGPTSVTGGAAGHNVLVAGGGDATLTAHLCPHL